MIDDVSHDRALRSAKDRLVEEFAAAVQRRIEERGGASHESSMLWFIFGRRSVRDQHESDYEIGDFDEVEPMLLLFDDSPLR